MNLRSVVYTAAMLFFSVGHLSSFVYEIQVLRFWNKTLGSYQYIVLCSDFHDIRFDAVLNQRSHLLNLLKKSKGNRISVILEDLHSPNIGGDHKCAGYRLHASHGLLAGLTKECKDIGLRVANVEYRYARAIALGGTVGISNQYRPAQDIYVKSLLDEIIKAVREVRKYFDGTILDKYYKNVCNRVMSHRLFRSLKKERVTSVFNFYQRSTPSNNSSLLKQLLIFDSPLLDCKLIHQIVTNHKSRLLLVIAGGIHCSQVSDVLWQVGYELIEKTSNTNGLQAHNVVSAQIACGSFLARKPRPVSLHLLKKYLRK